MEWSENHIREKRGHLERYIHLPPLSEGKVVDGLDLERVEERVRNKLEELGGLRKQKEEGRWPVYAFEYGEGDVY